MSFGSKIRFTAQKGPSGSPAIYWEIVMDKRRGNPPKTNKNATRTVGQGRGNVREQQKPAARNPRTRQKGGSSDIAPGTVTLTQTQLDAILSTVGSLVAENQDLHNKNLLQDDDVKTTRTDVSENIFNLVNKQDRDQEEKPRSGHSNRGTRFVEPDEVPGLGRIEGPVENGTRHASPGVRNAAPSAVPGLGTIDQPPRPVDIPKAHMTKAELKRLQWDRERAVDLKSPLADYQDSPLFGVGSRKAPLTRHNSLAPILPKAHLTKAERLRRELAENSEEANSNPVSPGRTLTQFWSNEKINTPSADEQLLPPSIPKAHLTKAEIKRKQWEQERAENAERDAVLNKPAPQRSRLPEDYSTLPPTGGAPPAGGVPRGHLTKAEQKRLQWEKERADMEPYSKQVVGYGQPHYGKKMHDFSPSAEEESSYVPSVGMSKLEIKRLQWEKERADLADMDKWHNTNQKPAGKKPQQSTSDGDGMDPRVPYAAMSKAELKRQQWEEERAESDSLANRRGESKQQRVNSASKSIPDDEKGSSYVPSVGMSKAEMKRRQWEKERAENDAREKIFMGGQEQNNRRPQQFSPSEEKVSTYVPTAATSKAELKRRQWEKERAENEGLSTWQMGDNQQPTHGRRQKQMTPDGDAFDKGSPGFQIGTQPISKGELKRLQWQKERQENEKAEQQGEYNPWGRPGAGAPIRDQSGHILSDYNQRQEEEGVRKSYQDPPGTSSEPPAEQPAIIQKYRQNQAMTNTWQPPGTVVPGVEANKPAAIRSSFAFGNAAPDDNRFMSVKEKERREWLEELERQREEKRLEKLKEKEKRRLEDADETWADRYAPPANTAQVPQTMRTSSAPNIEPASVPGLDLNATGPQHNQQDLNSARMSQQGNFLRGQNAYVDPTSKKEMDEKRQRQLEHQEAVKAQVEENQRKKKEERERRAREEIEEERKLQAERDNLQAMYDNDRKKAQDKEEAARKRMQSLKDAMDAAAEEAHREKHARRMAKLQQGGHDISHLNANFEGKSTLRQAVVSEAELLKLTQAKMTPRAGAASVQHIQPSAVPGLDITPRDVAVMNSSVSANHEPYVSNRVIVPTKYKEPPSMPYSDPVSPRREFGVQTDLGLGGGPFGDTQTLSRQSTDIEYQGPFKTEKKVRVKSSDSVKNKKVPQNVKERPRWGAGSGKKTVEKKKPVKQSEKDPYYEKRKQAREAQKLQRQQDMMEMAEKSLARARNLSNMRTRSKSRDRNQGGSQAVDQRTRSLANGSNKGSSPTVLKARSNQASPARTNNQSRRRSSPDPVPGHRSRSDNPQGQRRSRRDTQENRPPPAVRSHRGNSPPDLPNGLKARDLNHRASPPLPTTNGRSDYEYDLDSYAYQATKPSNLKQDTSRSHYSDRDPLGAPRNDGDFVPFVRTAAILDPQNAEIPLPMSREGTAVENARKAYIHGIQPASYGTKMPNYEDKHIREAAIPEMPTIPEPEWSRDPIMNPSLLKDHPTGRQDRILQQLSDLRRGLMQKQRELEVASPLIDA